MDHFSFVLPFILTALCSSRWLVTGAAT